MVFRGAEICRLEAECGELKRLNLAQSELLGKRAEAKQHGFDMQGPDVGVDWSDRNGFACCCQWASACHGNVCPEHGKVGVRVGAAPPVL